MNERQEQTADVLGKLTVLGTIVLPMNIVTGMWGESNHKGLASIGGHADMSCRNERPSSWTGYAQFDVVLGQ